MKAPLWNFYNELKQKSKLILTIDQYDALMQALHYAPVETARNPAELREFCKLFLLSDDAEELVFDQIFAQVLDWRQFIKKEGAEDKAEEQEVEDKLPEGRTENKKTKDPSRTERIIKRPPKKTRTQREEIQEVGNFEVVIDEIQGADNQEDTIRDIVDHSFSVHDGAIEPFQMRNVAQRLREKVQTPTREVTCEVNMPMMIEKYCDERYIENIIYKVKKTSQSNIVLLADRFGSMLAYEFWETHLWRTFRAIPSCRFEHYFFYNLPAKQKSDNAYLLKNVNPRNPILDTNLNKWTTDTWFFIFSDAGGHSGMVNDGRLWATMDLWDFLKNISPNVFWLNPVPTEYMNDCTAKRLQWSIPMYYPDNQGFHDIFKFDLKDGTN